MPQENNHNVPAIGERVESTILAVEIQHLYDYILEFLSNVEGYDLRHAPDLQKAQLMATKDMFSRLKDL